MIPQTQFPTRETLYRKSVESLKVWKERVNSNDIFIRQDSGITINLDANIQEETRSNQNIINKVTKEEYTGASPGELIPIFLAHFESQYFIIYNEF